MSEDIKDKNILYLAKTMDYGGTEKVILQLCENLKNDFNKIIVCSKGGIHMSKLAELGITHYEIGDYDDKSFANIFKTIVRLINIVRSENISIIHSHHRMATFYAKIISNFTRCKVVCTAHNTFNDRKIFTKFSLSNIDIVAVGENVKKNLTDYFELKPEKIEVIYNGISLENALSFEEVKEISEFKKKDFFVVGNIGRLSEQKGFKYFNEAISELIKQNKNIRFIIVGDGELKDELVDQCKFLNIEKYVKFLGFRRDISNIISQLDLVVLSSLWEGLPLTPIEAFSQRKTVIGTNVDGTPEIIKDGYNGLLVEARNSKQLSEAILKLYKNKEDINKYEKNAFDTYRNLFDLQTFTHNYRKFYLRVVNET
ncbi:glycosyltransferase family 4 protein [Clostridium fungisolvens]|uniref:D-inositol-3-phosphate glycosyltransferase n=1 Tax=Clostridium fungisolvens TaxID=1604897 RepID=A0A6V8SGC2_9CLOT|nr:glycosyltransferase family 4 protein [Clostridium fungisolvens]GFP74198.1 D-inositol-3-phosphate glycosyltransferase [Clostridium fungisolvens]